MYAVKQNGAVSGWSETLVWVRLHENGCYVPCEKAEAEGFCAKLAAEATDEDGQTRTVLRDTVFALAGRRMRGTEPEGEAERISGAAELYEANSALGALEAVYDAAGA